jgi:hypothetical protein
MGMSAWTHAICHDCWDAQHPYIPSRRSIAPGAAETCCYCGSSTRSGIYVRENPETIKCNGKHGIDHALR